MRALQRRKPRLPNAAHVGAEAPTHKARSFVIKLLLALSTSFLAAALSIAGTVSGTVTNGTTGKPAAGVDVILIQLQGTMQPVAQTKTEASGHYQLDNPALGNGPMLIRAVYRGVNYHEPAVPGKTTVDIQVFEPTEKSSAFTVTARAIILEPGDSGLVVNEEYLISNKSEPPVAYYKPGGSFEFSIPADAQMGDVAVVGTSGMPVKQAAIDKGKNTQAVDYPFRPGDSSVRLSYKIPYPGNATSLKFSSPYAINRVAVFAPPAMRVLGNGFNQAGQQSGFTVYMKDSVPANKLESVAISGTGPVPQGESAANGENAGGDDTQNPAVNSRAEASGPSPVASLTTMPARLDSVRWYVVGGFAAIFALGLLYIWRQPRVAVAGTAIEVPAGTVASDAKPAKQMATNAPISPATESLKAAPANGDAAKSLDREVRGSLDELKDVLFKLELRREAGTITEKEYISERDRVQAVLRDMVKG